MITTKSHTNPKVNHAQTTSRDTAVAPRPASPCAADADAAFMRSALPLWPGEGTSYLSGLALPSPLPTRNASCLKHFSELSSCPADPGVGHGFALHILTEPQLGYEDQVKKGVGDFE